MRFVPVKREETQGAAMVFRVRELLIRQRTQAINASCRKHAFGVTRRAESTPLNKSVMHNSG
jgi:transposase